MNQLLAFALASLAIACMGCQSARVAEVAIPDGDYNAAFEIAKDVLRDEHFVLDRVDAREGVLTTTPRPSAGILAPWDSSYSGIGGEVEDCLHEQHRIARVTFLPTSGVSDAVSRDARLDAGAHAMRIQVQVFRIDRPGRRVEPTAVGLSRTFADPLAGPRPGEPVAILVREDPTLAAALARRVESRLAKAESRDDEDGAP